MIIVFSLIEKFKIKIYFRVGLDYYFIHLGKDAQNRFFYIQTGKVIFFK